LENASVAEWSIAVDCKSIAHWATQVRILPGAHMKNESILQGVLLFFMMKATEEAIYGFCAG
jgi:hypothetical protein